MARPDPGISFPLAEQPRRNSMRIALCYPPDLTVPTAPFGSLPLLQACVRERGHEALTLDLAVIGFHWLIRPESLQQFYDYAASADPARRAGFERLLTIPREVVFGAEQAARDLRDPDAYFEPARLRAAWGRINAAVELLSIIRPRFDPRNKDFARDLFGHLEARGYDKWLESYDVLIRPRLDAFGPGLFAITIPFSTQILPAMSLARWAHETYPGCKVVAGGTGLSDAEDVLLKDPRFYDYIDYAVVGDGEEALPELASALEQGAEVTDVPGLFRRVDGAIVEPANRRMCNMDDPPTPDFDGIEYDLYLAPEKIAIITTSRGCYYGKCTFCPESFRLRFRRRSSPVVWQDIKDIVTRQGVKNFMFWDPLTPPGVLTEISERSKEEGIELNWTAEVKFEHIYTNPKYVRTLAEGGCRYLQFGFESGVQRVLDGMDKGNDLGMIDVILDRLGEVGIAVGVFFFIGFPTEFEDDARETWRYLVRNRERLAFGGYVGTFGLGHDVPAFKHPDRFGIDIYYDELGNPCYRRRDGGDWDHSYLHRTYRVRSDQYLIESCAALLYARQDPAAARRLSSRWTMGPPSFIRPALERDTLSIPRDNGFRPSEVPGSARAWAFVARSGDVQEIDADDLRIVEAVRARKSARDVLALPIADVRTRLARLLDHGILDRAPMTAGEPIAGEPQRREVTSAAG